ncbi:MAG: cytochrome c oxidase subunit 3 [Rhabdochlamydiaceae bacterium]|jgi:cytochrome o ubiquinol oxidase subunit 3
MMATASHEQEENYSKTLFGFWVYLLSDLVLFGALFATYAVLRKATYGGPSAADLFNPSYALIQTLILLTASFTSGLGKVFTHRGMKKATLIFYSLTFLLGAAFMTMGYTEWNDLVSQGNSWKKSAFLSAFFTLIGTHSLHIICALLWSLLLLIPVCKNELTPVSVRRLSCLTMFWQFLNVVWIFIFSIVYLLRN